MTKKELVFYCKTGWPLYTLDYREGGMAPKWFPQLLYHHTTEIVLPVIKEMGQNLLCPGVYIFI